VPLRLVLPWNVITLLHARCRVTRAEAERWLETKEERDKQSEDLRVQVIKQFEQRGLEVPPALRQSK
jgi:hypothetical protein